jgi:NAD(P)-dependent dehydrogenase (short-subunit alcohol dehydrogenase family)
VFEVNFFGTLNVIRAALPFLRRQRSGHIVNLSSIAGLAPGAGSGLYAAAKCAVEGLSQSLWREVTPLGIKVTAVEPGQFRTDFLSERSIRKTGRTIEDYAASAGALLKTFAHIDGRQTGDPAKGARAIIQAVQSPNPPQNLLLGSDALRRTQQRLQAFNDDIKAWEAVTLSTDFN